MKDQDYDHNIEVDPADCRYLIEWMSEAGIIVDSIETGPAHVCSACRPADLHAAA
jgi:hypothetical protein